VYARPRASGLIGTVEIVRTGERFGFSSAEELLEVVSHGRRTVTGARKRSPTAGQ
jgi:hypothetical protein